MPILKKLNQISSTYSYGNDPNIWTPTGIISGSRRSEYEILAEHTGTYNNSTAYLYDYYGMNQNNSIYSGSVFAATNSLYVGFTRSFYYNSNYSGPIDLRNDDII